MFSRPVREVASTRIFARHLDDGEQALVYSMNVGLSEPTAMILPLPVPPDPGDDALRFVDLSGYSAFFEHLDRAFPAPESSAARGGVLALNAERAHVLKVHRVGDFVASFVPSRADFARLDPRFRLDDAVWSKLPYDDWGFAVFQLAPEERGLLARVGSMLSRADPAVSRRSIHPMAFVFPRRDPRTLFFPTLHVHDGSVHPMAEFDHQLYCQPDPITAASFTWRRSDGAIGKWVDAEKAGWLIDPGRPAFLLSLIGTLHNRDITLTPPDVTLETLRPRDELWAAELDAYPAYFSPDVGEPGETQRRVSLHHLDEVKRRLSELLTQLTQQHRADWQLDAYDEDAPLCSMSSTRSIDGSTEIRLTAPGQPLAFGPAYKPPAGRGRLRFGVRHDQLGTAGVMLVFSELPDSDAYLAIQAALNAAFHQTWLALEPELD